MDINIERLNQIAWKSLPISGTPKVFRPLYRQNVYALSSKYANFDAERKRRESIGNIIDSEPWPFSDPRFCPWAENDDPLFYSLFPNPSGFVTGHSTAYISAMLANLTGSWPTVRSIDECRNRKHSALAQKLWVTSTHRFDAKNWGAFLALNGFTEHTKVPKDNLHYVGINGTEGEFGQLVWFWRIKNGATAVVTTREKKKFKILEVPVAHFDWVEIPTK